MKIIHMCDCLLPILCLVKEHIDYIPYNGYAVFSLIINIPLSPINTIVSPDGTLNQVL